MTTVALVEDDAATREHLAHALGSAAEFRVVASEGTLAGGLAALERLRPEIVLTDLGLPDGSGIELVRAAARAGALPLVITVFGDEEHVVAAIRAGALGYLLKSDSQGEIVSALREIVAGGSPISPGIARYLLGAVRAGAPGAWARCARSSPSASARCCGRS